MIRIENISVRNLGPLEGELQLNLKLFNLIYGRNERGKTYLVEFILQSLFNRHSKWPMRSIQAAGKVAIAGLNDGLEEFSPSSRKKLEDFLEEDQPGLPANLARLLVVKGAELSLIENSSGGVSRTILKEFLSREAVLDEISDGISATVRNAKIEEGIIQGRNQGEIKSYGELRNKLDLIDGLLEDIDEQFSDAHRIYLEREIGRIKQEIETQRRAKGYEAFRLSRSIEEHEQQRDHYPRSELENIKVLIADHVGIQSRIQSKQIEIEELKPVRKNYHWLKGAIEEYRAREAALKISRSPIWLVFTLLAAAAAIVFSGLGIAGIILKEAVFIGGLAGAGFAALGVILYARQQRNLLEVATDREEISGITQTFKDRFDRDLQSIADLMAEEEAQSESYHRLETLEGQLRQEQQELTLKVSEIERGLSKWDVKKGSNWDEAISQLFAQLDEIEGVIQDLTTKLARLDIDESDYVDSDPGVPYSKARQQSLGDEFAGATRQLESHNQERQSLKQRICQETGDDISDTWENLIQCIREKRNEQALEYRQLTAHILGGIAVTSVLEDLRQMEDEKIQSRLSSSAISDPLVNITQRYSGVRLEGEELFFHDDFSEFPLCDLSTGAQEQILLALRLGCASQLLGKDKLFLVLDDAFQHADWKRRVYLVDEMVSLAKSGWQVTYFTMDDHIRGLFEKAGKHEFKKEFFSGDLEKLIK